MEHTSIISQIFSRYLVPGMMFFLILVSTGCHRKGCTDPKANNYDSRHKKDDNSCEYDYEKFIGNYLMEEDCGGTTTYMLGITENSEDLSRILLNNLGGWQQQIQVNASVDGTSLSFDEVVQGYRFVGSGTINTQDSIFSINYDSFTGDNELITSCTGQGERQN